MDFVVGHPRSGTGYLNCLYPHMARHEHVLFRITSAMISEHFIGSFVPRWHLVDGRQHLRGGSVDEQISLGVARTRTSKHRS
jgi:hypothetical protein